MENNVIFKNVKQKCKLYCYFDKLSGQIVGSFHCENDLLCKRFLMTLCFDTLEKAKFNLGAMSIFIQREVWQYDFNVNEWKKFVELEDLVNEAVASLQDQSKVIFVKKDIDVVVDKKNS